MLYKWLLFYLFVGIIQAFPEQGRWTFELNQEKNVFGVIKGVYDDTGIYIKVACNSSVGTEMRFSYVILQTRCYQDRLDLDNQIFLKLIHNDSDNDYLSSYKSITYNHSCDRSIIIEPATNQKFVTQLPYIADKNSSINGSATDGVTNKKTLPLEQQASNGSGVRKRNAEGESIVVMNTDTSKTEVKTTPTSATKPDTSSTPQFTIPKEGLYIITIKIEGKLPTDNFSAVVDLDIKGHSGYLSVLDWPLLPFYGTMCIIYFIYGLVWLIVLAMQWRDLLRIQFWIGAVIFLGMVEKACFYAEYQSINSTGTSVRGAVLLAEFVSCMKRTLARMLVIIVSLGFGIVKPRLGPMLHRVVGIGGLYLLLCFVESFLRVMRTKNESVKTLINLVQTTRTLRLRRNLVKLSLYRHFTNTLIFACIASVAFMIWVYRAHHLPNCVTDWKELWVDDAYWHLLFSVVLLVIMILWRPTNNNQRYAFTPLIDVGDEEDDAVMNGAYDGMKMRPKQQNPGTLTEKEPLKNKTDEDLAWVEENIPSADTTLPRLIDSDEEIMTTKFEMSKME
ncbi:hypothetical protein CHUAL_003325 [Chamberlinius hualienensis]